MERPAKETNKPKTIPNVNGNQLVSANEAHSIKTNSPIIATSVKMLQEIKATLHEYLCMHSIWLFI